MSTPSGDGVEKRPPRREVNNLMKFFLQATIGSQKFKLEIKHIFKLENKK